MMLLVNLYVMKFATDVLLIAPGVMGVIFGISRVWDAVSDPLVGFSAIGQKTDWDADAPGCSSVFCRSPACSFGSSLHLGVSPQAC